LNIKNANVTVIVSNIEKAISFYTNILGLKLDQRIDNQYAVLKTEGLTIGLNPIQHGLEPGNCKSMSIGFLIDNLDETISELKNKSIVFSDIIVEPPLRIAYFTDQDKNPLYICEYFSENNSKIK
jgi:catechol 2,3-dioxygenase-like lactoylglutathione lyase family enzyme